MDSDGVVWQVDLDPQHLLADPTAKVCIEWIKTKAGTRGESILCFRAFGLELSPRVTANCQFHHNVSSPAEDSLFNIYVSSFYGMVY